MLRQLAEYADRLDLPPPLYEERAVRYIVHLGSDGSLQSRQPYDTADPSNRATRRGHLRQVPQVARAVGIKPLLLADNAEYTLGLVREGSRPDRVQHCHAAFLDSLGRCAAHTQNAAITTVHQFLLSDPLTNLELPNDFDASALITFQVGEEFLVDLPAVQAFWAAEHAPTEDAGWVMQCLICGHQRPVLARLQGKIRGVPGGQMAGTSIISANAEAFESYGLKASLISPTCSSCGERFTKGANDLLAHQESRYILGGAAFIFWTREDVGFSIRSFFDDPNPEEVRALVRSVMSGEPRADIDATGFYATVLSNSGGRTVVREWIDQTVGEAKVALAEWFEDQALVDRDGREVRPLGLYPLAAATVRDASKELAPPTIRALLRAALTGTPAPFDLLARAVRRNRADGGVTHPRAALIKLVLARQGMSREEVRQMTQLATEHPNPAYHCGRLLAVLDAVQRAALGSVNATVVDRYFGTASSAPGTVFPYLIRGSAPHLAKLRKTRPGAYQALQQRLEEVMGQLPEFRSVLTLQEQGLFALGFYHQRADDRRRIREAGERQRANAASTAEMTADDEGHLTDEELRS